MATVATLLRKAFPSAWRRSLRYTLTNRVSSAKAAGARTRTRPGPAQATWYPWGPAHLSSR
jgi:hypothetical protein